MTNKKNEIIIHEENKDSMSLPVIQWEGQRVITLQQVAEVHGIEFESVRRSFKNNQNKRFTPSVHYFEFNGKNGRNSLLDANMECRSKLENPSEKLLGGPESALPSMDIFAFAKS